MSERDTHDPHSAQALGGPPATPRTGGGLLGELGAPPTPPPTSATRAASSLEEAAVSSAPSDTLLSAGRPAGRLELLLDDHVQEVGARFTALEERLEELDSRVAVMEHKKSIAAPEPRQKPWLWIAFLLALVIAFQLLHRVR